MGEFGFNFEELVGPLLGDPPEVFFVEVCVFEVREPLVRVVKSEESLDDRLLAIEVVCTRNCLNQNILGLLLHLVDISHHFDAVLQRASIFDL